MTKTEKSICIIMTLVLITATICLVTMAVCCANSRARTVSREEYQFIEKQSSDASYNTIRLTQSSETIIAPTEVTQEKTETEDAAHESVEIDDVTDEKIIDELKTKFTKLFYHPEEITKKAILVWLHLILAKALFGSVL